MNRLESSAQDTQSPEKAMPVSRNTVLAFDESAAMVGAVSDEDQGKVNQREEVAPLSVHPVIQLTRKQLYDEIWEISVAGVARKYGVPYMRLLKQARAADVAIPASGYWVKLNAGKSVEKPELSGNPNDIVAITGSPIEKALEGKSSPKEPEGKSFVKQEKIAEVVKTGGESERQLRLERDSLTFLSEQDREAVLAVAARIHLPHENEKMHPNIIAHRKAVVEWQKQRREKESKGWSKRNMPEPPFLADTISEVSLPRVCRIIDGLIKAMEPLGCSLAQDLTFLVRGERVTFSVSEAKDEVEHVLTKEENLLMLKYVEEKRRYPSTPMPTIRKHDHLYNGRLTFAIHNQKYFRNGKAYVLEDRQGDIMVQFYEVADVVRREREARAEAERKRLEEQRKKEERIKSHN